MSDLKKIVVANAGDERVNGTYIPVDTMPLGAGSHGPLIWRHETTDWIHIMN